MNQEQNLDFPNNLYIHLGTYDGSIIGFQAINNTFKNFYGFTPNLGSIKTIKAHKRYLITGGNDEIMRLYDIKKKKDIGLMGGHQGTITCIQAFQNFIISGSEDGNIILWKTREWSLLHLMKGHKKSVNDIALHNSGKLMASVGNERKLILWDLMKGVKIYRKTMKFNSYKILWSHDENFLIIMSDKTIYIIGIEDNLIKKELTLDIKINDFTITGDFIIAGGDDGYLYFWNNVMKEENFWVRYQAHKNRVKKFKIIQHEEQTLLFSCSTDGSIRVWNINKIFEMSSSLDKNIDLESTYTHLYEIKVPERITCMDVDIFNPNVNEPENNDEKNVIEKPIANNGELDDENEEKDDINQRKNKLSKKSKKIKKTVQFKEPEIIKKKPIKDFKDNKILHNKGNKKGLMGNKKNFGGHKQEHNNQQKKIKNFGKFK